MDPKKAVALVTATTGLVGAYYVASRSLFTVEGGQRAIIFNRFQGLKSQTYAEGIHLCAPYFEWPIVFDTRTRPYLVSSPMGTKDLQTVNISLRVLFRPNPNELQTIYRKIGHNYNQRILPSICNEVLKSIVARYNASELITRRTQISRKILTEMKRRANDFNIILEDVAITELTFSPKFAQSVEAKQIALQEAQRAEFVVQQAEQERQRKIVAAEGEAESAKLVGKALSDNPMYLKLRKIETGRRIANTLSKSQNTAYLDSDNLLLNIFGDDKAIA